MTLLFSRYIYLKNSNMFHRLESQQRKIITDNLFRWERKRCLKNNQHNLSKITSSGSVPLNDLKPAPEKIKMSKNVQNILNVSKNLHIFWWKNPQKSMLYWIFSKNVWCAKRRYHVSGLAKKQNSDWCQINWISVIAIKIWLELTSHGSLFLLVIS